MKEDQLQDLLSGIRTLFKGREKIKRHQNIIQRKRKNKKRHQNIIQRKRKNKKSVGVVSEVLSVKSLSVLLSSKVDD